MTDKFPPLQGASCGREALAERGLEMWRVCVHRSSVLGSLSCVWVIVKRTQEGSLPQLSPLTPIGGVSRVRWLGNEEAKKKESRISSGVRTYGTPPIGAGIRIAECRVLHSCRRVVSPSLEMVRFPSIRGGRECSSKLDVEGKGFPFKKTVKEDFFSL